eukprot:GCRY01001537.1.p1 GENE.GCRY01001537.1~~GCRY01001537.1.p1  ORF type:complete len:889 (-),score=253.68 GCRY01001537.1:154-2820(-)
MVSMFHSIKNKCTRPSIIQGLSTVFTQKYCHVFSNSDIYYVVLDNFKEESNFVDDKFIEELKNVVDCLNTCIATAYVSVVIFVSMQKQSFLSGLNLRKLSRFSNQKALQKQIKELQDVVKGIADLPALTFSAVDGDVVSTGLEFLLATDYRFARADRDILFSFPDCQHGLSFCCGGTKRLVDQVGLPVALDMVVQQHILDVHEAKHVGLIDDVLECKGSTRDFIDKVKELAVKLVKKHVRGRERLPRALPPNESFRLGNAIGRFFTLNKIKRDIRHTTPVYAHQAVVLTATNMILSLERDDAQCRAYEQDLFTNLAFLPATKAACVCSSYHKKYLGIEHNSPCPLPPDPLPNETALRTALPSPMRVIVVGLGRCGSALCARLALRGCAVTVVDDNKRRLTEGILRVQNQFDSFPHLTRAQLEVLQGLITSVSDYKDLSLDCPVDLVVECVTDTLENKEIVMNNLARVGALTETTVYLAMTLGLAARELAKSYPFPRNFATLHAYKIPQHPWLFEVVVPPQAPQAPASPRSEDNTPTLQPIAVVQDKNLHTVLSSFSEIVEAVLVVTENHTSPGPTRTASPQSPEHGGARSIRTVKEKSGEWEGEGEREDVAEEPDEGNHNEEDNSHFSYTSVINRCVSAYFAEAIFLVGCGYTVAEVNQAALAFGFELGPFELMDVFGLKTSYHMLNSSKVYETSAETLAQTLRFAEALPKNKPEPLMCGNKVPADFVHSLFEVEAQHPDLFVLARQFRRRTLGRRLFFAMLNTCCEIFAQGEASAAEMDMGLVHATGFPLSLGGPFHYADFMELGVLCKQMQAASITPHYTLVEFNRLGKVFHPLHPLKIALEPIHAQLKLIGKAIRPPWLLFALPLASLLLFLVVLAVLLANHLGL